MRKVTITIIVLVVSLALVIAACAKPAPAPAPAPAPTPAPAPVSAADFYKNNVVTIIVSSKPGGGTDYAARLFSTYWAQITGGNMKLVNEAGGGGLVGGNQVYKAKPDGLTIGGGEFGADVVSPSTLKVEGCQFKAGEFNAIGLFGRDPYAFAIAAGLPYKSIEELKKAKNIRFWGASKGGKSNFGSIIVAEVFGLDAVAIYGHEGSADAGLALGRGELDAVADSSATILDHGKKGWVKPPFVIVDAARSTTFPDVPAMTEVAKLTPEQERLFKYFNTVLMGGKGFYATPGVPADRIQFMRDTFEKIVADSGFLSQGKLRWPAWEKPIPGKDLQELVKSAATISKEDVGLLNQMVEKYAKK